MKKFNSIPSVLLTGASGFLGSEILKQLVEQSSNKISVISSQCDKIKETYKDKNNLVPYSYEDLFSRKISWPDIDVVINCSFARSNDSKLLAQSLDFTEKILSEACKHKTKGFINISSQSLYALPFEPPWREETPVVCSSLYAMTKYATEKMTQITFKNSNYEAFYCNVRLSSLSGPGLDARLSSKFVKSALSGESIKIKGGEQLISYMDVRDAAEGIIRLAAINPSNWKPVYNFGCPWSYKIIEIAEIVEKMAREFTDKKVNVIIEKENSEHISGMCSDLFYNDTGWKPQYDMKDIIRSLFIFLKEQKTTLIKYDSED